MKIHSVWIQIHRPLSWNCLKIRTTTMSSHFKNIFLMHHFPNCWYCSHKISGMSIRWPPMNLLCWCQAAWTEHAGMLPYPNSWMVYNGTSHWNGWFGSTTILGNPRIYIFILLTIMLHIHQGFVRIECVIPLREDWITSFWFTHGPRIQGTIREGLLFPSQRFDSLPYDPSRPTFVSWFTSPRGQQGVPMWQSQVRRPHHAAFGGVHSSAFLGPDSSAGPGSPSEMPVARQERATVRGVSWGGWTQEIHFTIRLIYRGQIIWQNKKS
jgi:hypothetical protein